MSPARPQPILVPLTSAAIFLAAVIDDGGEAPAVTFGQVSFTPHATSLITATTDNPAAFANAVIRCA
ncbi:hypothetical protein MSM1_04165 [Mycobacterium sp. SM1]|nr:hypothetical protein [Mycobacterium sp. SM1]MBS4727577.1 hypothetical protein [Mycobacterium sp. SM1]